MKKQCSNCKYDKKRADAIPCYLCINDEKWEPKTSDLPYTPEVRRVMNALWVLGWRKIRHNRITKRWYLMNDHLETASMTYFFGNEMDIVNFIEALPENTEPLVLWHEVEI